MNLCSKGHGEICYEDRSCPACDLLDKIKELEEENKRMESELDHALLEQG